MAGKTMYKLMVKVLNKNKLSGRSDTPWRAHLALSDELKPVWRALYKPPLTKRVGDLQWRLLHGIVAVNAFVSILNPNVTENCPFCTQRETVFHCFMDCCRLLSLFQLLENICRMFGEVFSQQLFILGFKYSQKWRVKCQLINFVLGQAKMAIYVSRRNKTQFSLDCSAESIFIRMVKARLKVDYSFYSATKNVDEFKKMWCYKNVLCSVERGQLLFGPVLSS